MGRKAVIDPERRQDWLRRCETIEGETPPDIAKKEDLDVRTIRKHLDLARLERDVHEAKVLVLRDAMLDHHKDLINAARSIYSVIKGVGLIDKNSGDAMRVALKQHVPSLSLWRKIDRWNALLGSVGHPSGQSDSARALLAQLERQVKNLQGDMLEELDVLIHKRLVPGKCKYCPF